MSNSSTIDRYLDAGEEPIQTLLPIEGYEKRPLVSLEEAIQRIKPLINDLDRKVWLAKRSSSNPTDDLTTDESAAIHLYTMQWATSQESLFVQLNRTLRSEVRDNLKPWFSYLKLFLTALYKLPSMKGTIWRGIHGDVSDQYRKDFIWWGFSSCTETMPILEQFIGRSGVRTIFMVECLTGKSIRNHSFYKKENEILLMPGTYLRVVDKWSPAEGLYMIRLQETDPPHKLIASPLDFSSSIMTTSPAGKISISNTIQLGVRFS
ncbi:unnamed protein product [Rotaria sp. Silwood2]|nr:unnamed protein product [Rotaria sp. Silwood2]CAF4209371.1 unnamed protein product [Rotaria sp. Silwood2]